MKKRLCSTLLILVMIISLIPLGTLTASGANQSYLKFVPNAEKYLGLNGRQIGAYCAWCAWFATKIINESGYNISGGVYPCDVVSSALNAGLANYYSFRDTNVRSLVNYHNLKRTDLLFATSRSRFTPRFGDVIVFLWEDDIPKGNNWSHIGFVISYDPVTNIIKTVEGNTEFEDPDWHTRKVMYRERDYDETVVGFIRFDVGNANYDEISQDSYYLKNKTSGAYLGVNAGADADYQNICTASSDNVNTVKFNVQKSLTTPGYSIRPLCSSSRMLIADGNYADSGDNVYILKDYGRLSQRWYFESVSGGYVIRSVENPDCVLDLNGSNVIVRNYSGSKSQIWQLCYEATDTFEYGDVNGDGRVNTQDRAELTRFLAKWKGYEDVDLKAADVNGDGKVNAQDRVILTRHLAKWKGYETLPYTK